MTVVILMITFSLVFVLCTLAVFSEKFEDNWFQTIGLIGMALSSISAVYKFAVMDWVPPEMVAFGIAAVSYGAGTALKVLRHCRRRKEPPRTVSM